MSTVYIRRTCTFRKNGATRLFTLPHLKPESPGLRLYWTNYEGTFNFEGFNVRGSLVRSRFGFDGSSI